MFLIEDYLNEKKVLGVLSESSINNRRYELNRFVNFCKGKGLIKPHEIDEKIIIDYLSSLKISKMTKVTIMLSLNRYMDYLLKENIIIKNYARQIERPNFIYPEADYLNFDEIENLFQVEADLATPKTLERNLLLMNLLFTLCLRVGEAVSLKFDDVRLNLKQLWINRKGEQLAKLPLNNNLINQFSNWFDARKKYLCSERNHIFLSNKGNPLTTRQARYIVSNALKRAGIKKRKNGCHILRHSGATYRLQNGENIKLIQFLLGHKTLISTEKYLHFNELELKDMINRSPEL